MNFQNFKIKFVVHICRERQREQDREMEDLRLLRRLSGGLQPGQGVLVLEPCDLVLGQLASSR